MKLLENKNAVITGGSRGIGESIVKEFVKQGANVLFTYRSSADQANALVKELSTPNQKIIAVQSDASSYQEAEELIKRAQEEFNSIDVLINNAGITNDTLMLRMSEEQWDQVIEVNLKSVFNLSLIHI